MKWNPSFVIAVTFAACLTGTPVVAQSTGGAAPPRVGLGVSISDVGELLPAGSEEPLAAAIVPTILIPINVTSWFRLEPEVGGYRNSTTVTNAFGSTSQIQTQRFSLLHIGAGAFLVTTMERFKLYYGARIAYLRYKQSSQTGSFPESYTYPSIPGWLVAPAIGAEYFLADHISLGGEVQVKFISWSADSGPRPSGGIAASTSITGTSTSTHGVLVLRFYFR